MISRALISISVLLAGLSSVGGGQASDGSVEAAVLRAARVGIPAFLRDLPRSEQPHFGMLKPGDVAKAEPGRPFPVYTIEPGAFDSLSWNRTLGMILAPTGEWYVPILVDGEWRLLLTVCEMDGAWKAVGISEAGLAAELGAFQARWPGLAERAVVPRDSRLRFVRVYRAAADFMHVLAPGREFVWPFESGRRALGVAESDLLPTDFAVPLLRSALADRE